MDIFLALIMYLSVPITLLCTIFGVVALLLIAYELGQLVKHLRALVELHQQEEEYRRIRAGF